jgi:hypothetical protein
MTRFGLMAVAALAASSVAVSSAFAGGAKVVSFADPAGDGAELDVTLVTVDADRTAGTVKLAVTVTGFDPGSWDGRRRNIQVYLDTDLDRSTPAPNYGSDLMFMADLASPEIVPSYGRPKPPSWPFLPLPPTMSFSQSGNVLTWVFPLAELGPAGGFDFLMYTQIQDSPGTLSQITDHAPDGVGRFWRYYIPIEFVAPPQPVVLSPVFGSALTVPSKPVAGKKLVFTLPVNRSDTGAPLPTATMTCDPTVAGAVVKHTESFTNGKARLSFVVPKAAKGKLLKIKVKITSGAQSATKVFSYRVVGAEAGSSG